MTESTRPAGQWRASSGGGREVKSREPLRGLTADLQSNLKKESHHGSSRRHRPRNAYPNHPRRRLFLL